METTNYSEKCESDTWSKQTQTNPILPVDAADKIILKGQTFKFVQKYPKKIQKIYGKVRKTYID